MSAVVYAWGVSPCLIRHDIIVSIDKKEGRRKEGRKEKRTDIILLARIEIPHVHANTFSKVMHQLHIETGRVDIVVAGSAGRGELHVGSRKEG